MSAPTPDPNLPSELSTLKTQLGELMRYASLSRLIIHASASEIRIGASEPGFVPGRILGTHMVLILVSGEALRLTFKLHFEMKTAKALASRIFGGDRAVPITEGQAIDFIREYGNLIAGSVVDSDGPLRNRTRHQPAAIHAGVFTKCLPITPKSNIRLSATPTSGDSRLTGMRFTAAPMSKS